MVPIYINAANVVLLNSLWEGSPNVIKESMACNKPLVTSRVGDVEYVIGQTEGCYINDLIEEDFVQSLKVAIQFEKEHQFTKGRDQIFEIKIDSNQIVNQLIDCYKTVIDY
jgi:glycosyltransferase involved in cell wall biosynthesis